MAARVVDVTRDLLETRPCAFGSCERDAERESNFCSEHRIEPSRRNRVPVRSSVASRRIAATAARRAANGHEPDGAELLRRMDAGEPLDDGPRRKVKRPTPAQARWTREAIIEAIQAHAATHGYPPTSTGWASRADDHPTANLVKCVFGTWANGIEAAGFPRPRRGITPSQLAAVSEREPRTKDQSAGMRPEPVPALVGEPSRSETADRRDALRNEVERLKEERARLDLVIDYLSERL